MTKTKTPSPPPPGVFCFENHMALNLIDATREFYMPDMRPYTIYHICNIYRCVCALTVSVIVSLSHYYLYLYLLRHLCNSNCVCVTSADVCFKIALPKMLINLADKRRQECSKAGYAQLVHTQRKEELKETYVQILLSYGKSN